MADNLLTGVKLGKKYDVPTDELYNTMFQVLSATKGKSVEGVPSSEKSKICARYMLINQYGRQFVAGKETRKPPLKQSDLPNVSSFLALSIFIYVFFCIVLPLFTTFLVPK